MLTVRPVDWLPEIGSEGVIVDNAFVDATVRKEVLVKFDSGRETVAHSSWLREISAIDRLGDLAT